MTLAVLSNPAQAGKGDPQSQSTLPPPLKAVFLPVVLNVDSPAPIPPATCPVASDATFTAIPVEGPPADHPDTQHGDLNLSLRGYVQTPAHLGLVDINGAADADAPQLPGLFTDGRTGQFTSAHRVYEWDWSCGEHGCRSPDLTPREVTLAGLAVTESEAVHLPGRRPEIYGGGFIALVLYAEENRITLGYTRRDSVASGYAVHIEHICVDPALLSLYRELNAAGRGHLPALRSGEALGTARGDELLVAVRDRGTFMDPRSRKDWWQGVGSCWLVADGC